jgi:hypothetical protein
MATMTAKTERLADFVTWVGAHITGDEKGEAQIFLDRLFKGFGHAGLKEAGATCEKRIKNDSGGTSFADLVWKPWVVIEMKKRGADLGKHYSQAFTYWIRLVPNRPRYAVLCNFDEFWIYDFETQLDTPVDKISLAELPNKYGPLNFMFPGGGVPVFGNHQETVTRQAADKLAECFNLMIKRGVEQPLAQRFILQMLMALFAEDIGLLEKYLVTNLLDECKSKQNTYDLIGGLFEAMNTEGGVKGGRFSGVAYFNGGLFAQPARVELDAEQRSLLKEAAQFDWSKVRPEIFGTIFEHSLGKEARHATGAHYTSPVDIMKVVGPTIVTPWTEQIERADTLARLRELLAQLENFTVLDPACGSGNFLYVAYREMKRLEARIYERMAADYKSVDPQQRPFGFVSARNFYGMDINPFAVDIAKVTMMLAHKLSIDELNINENALPLDNLDANFRAGDALVNEDGTRALWFKTDVVVGNPPFLGAKLLKPAYGADYVNKVRAAYPAVPGMADFCVYWFRRVHDELKVCTADEPMAGRAGLVGTQNIRSNASRMGGLDYITATGTLVDAVDNQPWSGEANVHVSIANWVKTQDDALLPKTRRLWFQAAPPVPRATRSRGAGPASKQYELDMREVGFINSSLSDKVDVAGAVALSVNANYSYTGQYPRYNNGFVMGLADGERLLAADVKNSNVVRLFAGGDELLGSGKAARYVIDFQLRSIVEAQAYKKPFEHVRNLVLPYVQELARKERVKTSRSTGQDQGWLNTWWQHFRPRAELIAKIEQSKRYLVCSRVTKRPLFMFLSSSVRPSDALTCFAMDDNYSFGILQSQIHYLWFHAKCSNMKSDPRYTSESVFHTFPWPQAPTKAQIEAVAVAGVALRHLRAESSKNTDGGLRSLYRTLDLPGKNPLRAAHAVLDTAVLAAYGFSARKDVLQQLLDLNTAVAANIEAGKKVFGPGVPPSYKNVTKLITTDCFGI